MGMGSGRRKVGARHEPDFDAEPDLDPAVNAEDGASDASEPRRRIRKGHVTLDEVELRAHDAAGSVIDAQ